MDKGTGEQYVGTDRFRGGLIQQSELGGLEIRDCEVSGLKIVDCYGGDVSLGGDFDRLVVNDVDVTAYVEGELDRRHPERVLVRAAATPADFREAWELVESLWSATVGRVRALPEEAAHERVDGEFSFVETQRHLLFAGDAWLGSAVLEEDSPFHVWGLPTPAMPAAEVAALGLAPEARPSLEEVLGARRERMAATHRTLDDLDDAGLERVCGRKPAPPYPDQDYVVRRCLRTVLREEVEHHRYAVRDLAVIEGSRAG